MQASCFVFIPAERFDCRLDMGFVFCVDGTAFEIVEAANYDLADAWMKLHARLRTTKWATTAEAVPSAFACLRLVNANYRKGVTLAANFGRDADTIGAVCGAIAEKSHRGRSILSNVPLFFDSARRVWPIYSVNALAPILAAALIRQLRS